MRFGLTQPQPPEARFSRECPQPPGKNPDAWSTSPPTPGPPCPSPAFPFPSPVVLTASFRRIFRVRDHGQAHHRARPPRSPAPASRRRWRRRRRRGPRGRSGGHRGEIAAARRTSGTGRREQIDGGATANYVHRQVRTCRPFVIYLRRQHVAREVANSGACMEKYPFFESGSQR